MTDNMKFFEENDSPENRAIILKTDKLRYWYCYLIEDRPEIAAAIEKDPYKSLYHSYLDLTGDRAEVLGIALVPTVEQVAESLGPTEPVREGDC